MLRRSNLMSKSNLLTVEEDAQAAAQGWGLHHVYDLATHKWGARVLPAQAAPHVMHLARANHALPLKAMKIIKEYHVQTDSSRSR